MIDDEEIVKALSLEEKALDEFKRRKNSFPQPQSSGNRSYDGKMENKIQQVRKVSQFIFRFPEAIAAQSSDERRNDSGREGPDFLRE